MGTRDRLTLRERALESLEKSTKMLQVAMELLTQGNQAEATRLRKEARKQRILSTLLMAEANTLEAPGVLRSQQFSNKTRQELHNHH